MQKRKVLSDLLQRGTEKCNVSRSGNIYLYADDTDLIKESDMRKMRYLGIDTKGWESVPNDKGWLWLGNWTTYLHLIGNKVDNLNIDIGG